MKRHSSAEIVSPRRPVRWRSLIAYFALIASICVLMKPSAATAQDDLSERVQKLNDAMDKVQKQIEESKRQLDEMRKELDGLQQRAKSESGATNSQTADQIAAQLSASVTDLRERQAMQDSQIATLDQSKVETESKFPIKLNGMVLFNGFVNTRGVDSDATPSIAVAGSGSTGATMRQTILGLNARGPHLFGASSHADIHFDFDGSVPATTGYAWGYGVGLARLRTAHATLDWDRTQAFFSLDRPILSPTTPDSLTAVAMPALAWSGNLWTWNPQFGVMHDLPISDTKSLRAQFALIDVPDAPNTRIPTSIAGVPYVPATGEQSRWPGVEARFAFLNPMQEHGIQLGVGGFYAPHTTAGGTHFESWAGTLDYRIPLPLHMELSGSAYRGLALGGLGGGAYKDYVYRTNGIESYFLSLDDVGGWSQWKQRLGERLELNEAFGIDSVPAGQLRPYVTPDSTIYQSLARNRTFTGNVVYSPSAYLLFSLEYRRIESSTVNAPTAASDIIGIAAGYKF